VRPLTDAYVLEAELALREGVDPAAVGAAVTVELCGHWEHEIRDRIETALRGDSGWRLVGVRSRPIAEGERDLAERLLSGPRRPSLT
jgi:hypothetical protein